VKWPKRRRWHAATLLDEYHLYLLVGEYTTNDSWIFDITRRTWNEVSYVSSNYHMSLDYFCLLIFICFTATQLIRSKLILVYNCILPLATCAPVYTA
jgi:hypothetical protein